MGVRVTGTGREVTDPPRIEGLLSDWDGTIVDSERLLYKGWEVLCQRAGKNFREMAYSRIIGRPETECTAIIIEHFKLDRDHQSLYGEYQQLLSGLMDEELELRPGVEDFIDKCHALGLPICVVTSAVSAHVRQGVDKFELDGCFAGVVAADTEGLARRKPHPDPYLLGAKKLGAKPARCVAFEDTPTGLRAALDAGCFTFGLPHEYSLSVSLSQAHRLLHRIDNWEPSMVRFEPLP